MKKYTHESEELNALLGKKVCITLWHGKRIVGVLTRPTLDKYGVLFWTGNTYRFRKTHVKKIEVVE